LKRSILQQGLIQPGSVLGVGISGGADSVGLTIILKELQDELGISLRLLHVNHCLRGPESDGDEQFVREFAALRGLDVICIREDVSGFATANKLNLEDAARRVRYTFFDRMVFGGKVTHVATAHTMDDQAETVLARIFRGTGPTGLASIHRSTGNVIRPLLGVRRADLREYLRQQGQAWREDSTNSDESRLRSRIRSRLIPFLESDFQPAAVENLARLASVAWDDERYWKEIIDARFHADVRENGDSFTIAIGALDGSNRPAVTNRLVRRIARELSGGMHALSSEHVERVLALAAVPSGQAAVELPGVVVERSGRFLHFRRSRNETGSAEECHQPFAHRLALRPGCDTAIPIPQIQRRLRLKTVDWAEFQRDTRCYALDLERLPDPLLLRNWRLGDVYCPDGFLRSRKVKRLLQDMHLPAEERANWPVLESAGAVAWVRGVPVARNFAATEGTRTGLLIVEEPL